MFDADFWRYALIILFCGRCGFQVVGPAIVYEDNTSTFVNASFNCKVLTPTACSPQLER